MVTDPVFFAEIGDQPPPVGATVTLDGWEGHHAARVRRITVGESVVLSDGSGKGVRGTVTEVGSAELTVQVGELLSEPVRPLAVTVAQALAKRERAELAIEMQTELGVGQVMPWQADRCIVRWDQNRQAKAKSRWSSTVREATKQSRRLRIPHVAEPVTTTQLAGLVSGYDLALLLHESAPHRLADLSIPATGTVLIIVGPEGGVTPEEQAQLHESGADPVTISDGVLRSSTAGAVAIAQLSRPC